MTPTIKGKALHQLEEELKEKISEDFKKHWQSDLSETLWATGRPSPHALEWVLKYIDQAITQTAEVVTKAERERIAESLAPMFDLDKDAWRVNNERNKALEQVVQLLTKSDS